MLPDGSKAAECLNFSIKRKSSASHKDVYRVAALLERFVVFSALPGSTLHLLHVGNTV